MKKTIIAAIIAAITSTACSDAARAKLGAIGDAGTITCYSGGKAIYQGKSTGKIMSENGTDGWYFMESGTGDLIRISGTCVIRN